MRGGPGRRTAAVAATAAVLVGMLATGCGGRASGKDHGAASATAQAYTDVHEIPESIAPDGTTVRIGSPQAKVVVHVYEDLRCPVCKEFETQGGGEGLRDLVLSGGVRVEYTLASFLDERLAGEGSQKAANALRAALDAGRFVEYHEMLFAHQPEESVDGYTDAFLLKTASEIEGLRSTRFDAAVHGMKYRDFVAASEKAFEASGVPGTPGMKVNGNFVGDQLKDQIFDRQTLPLVIALVGRQ
ncbi:thioredoxin domain-containing protein [Streptomyces actuosus]|uniref:Thioredoxin domain-containing protein n=1 Tax=Streptomyces actuosus TaxID=1885 RepID=A0ABS2VM67_STRAS|nr:thioredoxin domain-containing protein [Streptomyces actuosus]MBN0044165.1 thioredoxin domain-containing protein [Streptomyces actuosus]